MENKIIKILAIDDNRDNLIILKALIEEAFPNAEVHTTIKGKEGINLAAEIVPDVILLDIIMPGIDGFEVCRQIKADTQLFDIPVVFTTALKGDKDNRIRALESGADAFLSKPIDESELVAQIRAMLKIKDANMLKKREKELLVEQVEEKTKELRQATEQLRRSEAMFRMLAENAMVGVYLMQDGKFVYANRTILEMFGYESKELIGHETLMLIYPEDHEYAFVNRRRRATGLTGKIEYEIRGLKKNQDVIILAVASSSIEYDNKPAVIVVMRDITESKELENSLRDSEARFRTLADNTLIGVYMTHNGKFAYVNHTIAEIFGRTADEMIGVDALEVIHPDDNHVVTDYRARRREGELGKFEYEVRALRPDGTIRNVAGVASATLINGKPIIIGAMRDITESKAAIEKLIESEERFRVLAENTLIGVYIAKNMRISYANKTLMEIFGFDDSEILGIELPNLIYPEDRQAIFGLRDKLFAGDITKAEFEARGVRKDGQINNLDIMVSAVVIGNQKLTIGAIQDITGKKHAYDSLRESEEFFRNSFENASLGACLSSLDGVFLRVNEMFCKSIGYTADELVGLPFNAITHPDDLNVGLDVLSKLTCGEIERAEFEKRYIHKNGHTVWCRLSAGIVRDNENRALYIVTYAQNITEQKRIEEEIEVRNNQLMTAAMETIECLGFVVETRDPYTSGHQRRVAGLAAAIAEDMGLSVNQISAIRIAGTVHDIGKMSIPAEILSKPTKLNEYEYNYIRQHAENGYQILNRIHFPWPIAEIVYQHHEHIDGSGYPRGLTGDQMTIEGKILCVADVVEAMSSHRPYRPALGIDRALDEIKQYSGSSYDAKVVSACIRLFVEQGYQLDS